MKYNLNISIIKFSTTVENLKRYLNKIILIKIQLYTCDSDSNEIYPLHISYYQFDQYNYGIHILLKTVAIDKIIENSHYVLIKNLNAFLNFKYNLTSNHLYYCPYCFTAKSRPVAIDTKYCSSHDQQRVEYPKRDHQGNRPILKFSHSYYNRQCKHPFVNVADMEASLQKNNDNEYKETVI